MELEFTLNEKINFDEYITYWDSNSKQNFNLSIYYMFLTSISILRYHVSKKKDFISVVDIAITVYFEEKKETKHERLGYLDKDLI